MTRRCFAGLAVGGTVALSPGWGAAAGFGTLHRVPMVASHVENTAASIAERAPTPPEPAVVTTATPVIEIATADANPADFIFAPAGPSAIAAPAAEPVLSDPGPTPPAETGMQLASVPTSDAVDEGLKHPVRAVEPADQCVTDICIDEYLWSLYEQTSKIDTVKVPERTKVTVKKKGKTRTVTQTVMKYVLSDFAWKDPVAAQRAGMSVKDYVIGGMDHDFKLKLCRALRMMGDAGLMPGITSGFRDNYRQSIATGNKAASDSSYHGGSRRGGYGHGLAADLVSVKGDTRNERFGNSEVLWKWIDAHEKELGIARPYLDRDPPHVGPIAGHRIGHRQSAAWPICGGEPRLNEEGGKSRGRRRRGICRAQRFRRDKAHKRGKIDQGFEELAGCRRARQPAICRRGLRAGAKLR